MNEIYLGDCIEVLKDFPKNFVHLLFADPPFNLGKDYDVYEDSIGYHEYVDWTGQWIDACLRVLKEDGSFYIAIGDEFVAEIALIMKQKQIPMRNWIIWHYTFGQNMKKKFSRTHTHILYFVGGQGEFTFNADSVRIPSDRQMKYNDRRAHPTGKVPDDVWEYSRVCGTFNERVDHPCQMPVSLLERIVLASSNRNEIVLDPFVGSGTTAVATKKNGRRYIGIDISEKYCEITKRRLEEIPARLQDFD